MSKASNTSFYILISILKYALIFISLIPLSKVSCSDEINFIMKSNRKDPNHWPEIIGPSFNNPTKVLINGKEHAPHEIWYDIKNGIINITLTYDEIKSYENMFVGVNDIEEITLVNFNTKKVTNMSRMFYGTNFKKIIFQNVDTSAVKDMSETFS